MLNVTPTSTYLDFPAWIEEVSARQNSIGMVQSEDRSQSHQAQERVPDKRRQRAQNGGKIQIRFTPTDGMIPDLQSTLPLNLTYYAVRSTDTMMRCLKDIGHFLGHLDGEDE